MASADLTDELTCFTCTDIYTDPVTLPCGHNFCRLCILDVLDIQEGYREYTCPECRSEFQERPALKENKKLSNIVKTFLSLLEEVGIPCTYCMQSLVPAAKTCLLCEASLCENHLRVHSKSAEHVLTEPTTSLGNRKCSVHMKDLEYYCCEDEICICLSCQLVGMHRRHQVMALNEASEKKKEELRNIQRKVTSEREKAEKRVQSLQRFKRQAQRKAAAVTEEVTALIRSIMKELKALEKRVLSEISTQEQQVSLRVSDLIRQLEIKKEDLSRKMGHIEELCNMTDPLTVLQGWESDRADYCEEGDNEATERHDVKVQDVGDLDVGLISATLHAGLVNIVTGVNTQHHLPEASDVFLDVNMASDMFLDVKTAGNYVSVSGDLKTISWPQKFQCRPETPERFKDFPQVLSCRSFFSGRHYLEFEVSEPAGWKVGMAYSSIDRSGRQSEIGNNNKSWAVGRWSNNEYYALTARKLTHLSPHPTCHRLGMFLDYEAGRLSFYELCDPIRHLHTFTAAFTEPLHAVLGVYGTNTSLRL